MPTIERRVTDVPWPAEMERRERHLAIRERMLRIAFSHAISGAMVVLLFGTIGLVVGTLYGSRPAWPAPIVFYVTSVGAILALIHALVRPARQPRIAAVLGVLATAALRGAAFMLQVVGIGADDADRTGLVVAAAVGAYLIAIGLGIIVVSQAFGETIGGSHRKWED